MSLRQQLLARSKVAQLQPLGVQPCNFSENSATGDATPMQLNPASPYEIRVSSATGSATTVQLGSCIGGQKTPPKVASSCSGVASVADPDVRVTCISCRSLWPGNRCTNHAAAELTTRDLAADFTRLRQHCRGFAPIARPPPPAPHPRPIQTEPDRPKTEQQQSNQPILKDDIMALTVSEGAGNYTPPDQGTYSARLVQLVDLGHQTSVWEGQEKTAHKILLTFEITDAENRRTDGTAHTISRRYTASLHPKAGLRKLLESWRGRPFTADELKSFDLKTLLGVPCLVGIIHETKGDKTFANLSSIMRLPKGFAPGPDTEPLVHFDLNEPDWQVFAQLSSRLQDQIAASPEFAKLTVPTSIKLVPPAAVAPAARAPATPAPAARAPAPAAEQQRGGGGDSGFDDMDDDVPF